MFGGALAGSPPGELFGVHRVISLTIEAASFTAAPRDVKLDFTNHLFIFSTAFTVNAQSVRLARNDQSVYFDFGEATEVIDGMADIPSYKAGDYLRIDYTCVNEDGSPQDISQATIRWSLAPISAISGLGATVLEKTPNSGIVIVQPLKGFLSVVIAAGELRTPGIYQHDLERIFPDGVSFTEVGRLECVRTIHPET